MDVKFISDAESCIDVFNDHCDLMAASKFIIAERHIRDILKSIAASSRLLSVFAYAARDFKFAQTFDRSVVVEGSHKRINLPQNAKDFIAFTYCLLLEIDTKSIDLHKLLTEFYYSSAGPNESYQYFAASVISPFKTFVNRLAHDPHIPNLAI